MLARMAFDFDRVISRRGGDSVKWNRYPEDVLPFWIADMDFAAPPAVIKALHYRVEEGVLGYAEASPRLVATVIDFLEQQYHWSIEAEHLVWLPGLVTGLNVACRAVAGEVITATPIYPPFMSAPRYAGQALRAVPLIQYAGRWGWDWDAAEAAVSPATRLFLLCHPHNPVGRAWNDEELAAIIDFCHRHELILCSDEIHAGLLLEPDRRHRPAATCDKAIAQRSITLMAPSKSFNIPGLGCAFAVIPDRHLRQRFLCAMAGIVPHINVLGLSACEAALRDSKDWHAALLTILRRNRDRVTACVEKLPGLSMSPVEASYLAWIDARGMGLENPYAYFLEQGLGFSDGSEFGSPGWLRFNFACPISTLDEGLDRLQTAVLRLADHSSTRHHVS